MGAHLSTIHGAVQHQFRKQDEGSKGYLTLKELMAVRTLYGINPCHVGVLYHVDRNHDGHFTMEEMQAFATLAQSYARAHRSFDAAYMTAGYTTLCLWRDLATVSGRDRFVQWAMRCFMAGYDLVHLEGSSEQYIHRKAVKALHVLFDVERNLGVDYQGLVDMMQNAAEEQQLLDPNNPDHDDWIPVQILQTFIESLADGVTSIMEISFPDQAELEEVIRSVQAGIATAAAGKPANVSSSGGAFMPTPPSGPRKSSGRGGRATFESKASAAAAAGVGKVVITVKGQSNLVLRSSVPQVSGSSGSSSNLAKLDLAVHLLAESTLACVF